MRRSRGIDLAAACLTLLAAGPPTALAAQRAEIVDVSLSGRRLARFRSDAPSDEFGAALGADPVPGQPPCGFAWVVGAPGFADSTGRVSLRGCVEGGAGRLGRPIGAVSGGSLAGGPVRRFGHSVLDLGHVDGSEPVDWAVGAPGGDGETAAAVVILTPEGGSLVERLRLTGDPDSRLGWALAPLEQGGTGSFNTSFATSAPGQRKGGKVRVGAVHRIDTLTGDVLWSRRGKAAGEHFGYSLLRIEDVDGDGSPDLLVGAPGRLDRRPNGKVLLLSGATGRVLRTLRAPERAVWFGFALALVDVDRDGRRDVVVGAPRTPTAAGDDAGAVYAYDLGGDRLLSWEGDETGQWLGVDVAAVTRPDDVTRQDIAASGLYEEPSTPRKSRRGGLSIFSVDSRTVTARRLGKRAGDRLGWPILGCSDRCRVGVPRAELPFLPD
ncbi:MAG: integrin alpha [Thermoanaerobaculia bacterium]